MISVDNFFLTDCMHEKLAKCRIRSNEVSSFSVDVVTFSLTCLLYTVWLVRCRCGERRRVVPMSYLPQGLPPQRQPQQAPEI